MKKIIFLLFVMSSVYVNAQATCTQTFTVSGNDNDPTVLTINIADLTCNGGTAPTAIKLVNPQISDGNCPSWYGFNLDVDGTSILSNQCNTAFNNIDITGFATLNITSQDNDNYAPGDNVTITIDVEVTFTPTAAPNCDAALTNPLNGATFVPIDGNLSWSAATGGVVSYNLTVGTTSGAGDVLATTNIGNVTSYALGVLNISTTYFVNIEPMNAIGTATGCTEESFTTFTPAVNDDCSNAVVLTVNPDLACGTVTSATLIGATASPEPNGCFGTADDDVWFTFVATSTAHTISLDNITGSTTDLYHVLYEGANCAALTQLNCSDPNTSDATGLTAGNTYYVRVYSWTGTPGQDSVFDVCIGTPPPPITADITTYTETQLIEDILIQNSDCATVSNVQFSSHSTGADTGIGYFTDGGSIFPFADGLMISSGRATDAPGPFSGVTSGSFNSPGDTDLETILGITNTNDATYIEFDFVPVTDQVSFNFIMASSEYNGFYECTYEDAFAFILTDAGGTQTNLAILPTTNTASNIVSVTNIHPEIIGSCAEANEIYFAGYTQASEEIAYEGRTIPLIAQANVVPGQSYHIKLVVADNTDSAFDTTIFLEGGSFSLGSLDLGSDVLLGDPAALCQGDTATLNAGVLPTGTVITWYQNGTVVTGSTMVNTTTGDTEQILDIDTTGDYTVEITYTGTTCSFTDDVHIEFYPNPIPNLGADVLKCANEELLLEANVTNANDPNMSALNYQWSYNGVDIPGATNDTYLITATSVSGSNGNANGTAQFTSPVDGSLVYVNVVNGMYVFGEFTVTATDSVTGCSGEDMMNVSFYENANCVIIPSGISPNGDGVNDCIVLDDLDAKENIAKMQVFNRYGTKVFDNANYVREWCGTNDSGDLLPTGTYYYVLGFTDGRTPLKGWVYINREI